MASWHHSHRGRCIGRVLHFLYHYCGFDVMEHAQIGHDKVLYHGETIATYEFLSDTDIPFFKFQKSPFLSRIYPHFDHAKEWETNQKKKVFEAIRDAADTEPKACDECRRLKLEVSMYKDIVKKYSK